MYPVCEVKLPLITLILESQVAYSPSSIWSLLPLPLLMLLPFASWRPLQDILLSLPGTLFHDVLLAQFFSPDGMTLHSKLTPEHPKEEICSKGNHSLPKQEDLGSKKLALACHD
ncbi:hypothetical protein DSO57_1021721 [Entomophthora muscae]|uniref:Uncharacterized protein n=1 Tax=Entomophthora muscae TaxID=34485 RepID=A0ACC2UD18_9FUNG|nr:hypothetical protein DSO57_1021721 [Entomophthora muscae]